MLLCVSRGRMHCDLKQGGPHGLQLPDFLHLQKELRQACVSRQRAAKRQQRLQPELDDSDRERRESDTSDHDYMQMRSHSRALWQRHHSWVYVYSVYIGASAS